MQTWQKRLLWVDLLLESWRIPLFLLTLVVILRLPNLVEPYWYGDEGIYLTIGNALRSGERLYVDIIDHKTPLIYYFAIVPSQTWFRIFNLFWMGGTTLLFYVFAKRLMPVPAAVWASLFFIAVTTLPWFEGNIPNGELFMMGFILLGACLFLKTQLAQALGWHLKKNVTELDSHESALIQYGRYWLMGIPFGLAILVKVPSLFDAVAFAGLWWWVLSQQLLTHVRSLKSLQQSLLKFIWPAVTTGSLFLVGVITPIIGSIGYFALRGSLAEYAQFGLLYNFHYAQNWGLPFTSPLMNFMFSLPGKFLVVVGIWGVLTVTHKLFDRRYQFVMGWLGLALFAALLSNRPYPHYFLQVAPPIALLLGLLSQELITWVRQPTAKTTTFLLSRGVAGVALIGLVPAILLLLHAGLYPTANYYERFWWLVTGRISKQAYQESFNGIIADNYRAVEILKQSPDRRLFIWGTNPMLYAQAQMVPIGRFTVAFHIQDLKLESETMEKVRTAQPLFIVVMNNDRATLPGLPEFLSQYYMPNTSFEHFTLWKHL